MLKRASLEKLLDGGGDGGRVDERGQSWVECLVRALSEMPQDVAKRILEAVPREVVLKTLSERDDPYVKLALLLLANVPR